MKGHLELFENALKAAGSKLPAMEGRDIDAVFAEFEERLGTEEIPFYDVHSGQTLADYYHSQFVRFVKKGAQK